MLRSKNQSSQVKRKFQGNSKRYRKRKLETLNITFVEFTFTVGLSFAPRCLPTRSSIQFLRCCQQPQNLPTSALCPGCARYMFTCLLFSTLCSFYAHSLGMSFHLFHKPITPNNSVGSLSGHVSKISVTKLFDMSTVVPSRLFQIQRGNWYNSKVL